MIRRTIPILPAQVPPLPPGLPLLVGEAAHLDRVMAALALEVRVEVGGRPVPVQGWVRGLHLEDGEARLAVMPGLCVEPAERAFDTLRRLLPDTDIYIGIGAA